MIGLGSIVGLREHNHEPYAYCLTSDRWASLDIDTLVLAGYGSRRLPITERCRVRGEPGQLQVRPPMPAWLNANEWRWHPEKKSPARGPVLNPRLQWVVHHDERLRIVPEELWQAVRGRQSDRSALIGQRVRRGLTKSSAKSVGRQPRYLFSGLLKCGCCGSNYVIAGAKHYACASYVNGKACSNSVRVRRDAVEEALLAGIRDELLSAESVREACRRVRLRLRQKATSAVPIAQIRQAEAEVQNLTEALATGALRASPFPLSRYPISPTGTADSHETWLAACREPMWIAPGSNWGACWDRCGSIPVTRKSGSITNKAAWKRPCCELLGRIQQQVFEVARACYRSKRRDTACGCADRSRRDRAVGMVLTRSRLSGYDNHIEKCRPHPRTQTGRLDVATDGRQPSRFRTRDATRAHYRAAPEEGPWQRTRTQDQEAGRPKMKFTIAIEPGTRKTAFGVVVPDLPGCFSAGDTVEEAFDNVREAIEAHCELLAEDGKGMPGPKPMSDWQANREYKGWTWGIVDVPVERFFGPAEKINITVPGRLLKQIDEHARAHGETRSGFLTKAALEAMRRA